MTNIKMSREIFLFSLFFRVLCKLNGDRLACCWQFPKWRCEQMEYPDPCYYRDLAIVDCRNPVVLADSSPSLDYLLHCSIYLLERSLIKKAFPTHFEESLITQEREWQAKVWHSHWSAAGCQWTACSICRTPDPWAHLDTGTEGTLSLRHDPLAYGWQNLC